MIGKCICFECGVKYGETLEGVSSYYIAHCDYCNTDKSVTSVSDFGYPFLPKKSITKRRKDDYKKTN